MELTIAAKACIVLFGLPVLILHAFWPINDQDTGWLWRLMWIGGYIAVATWWLNQ